MCCYKDQHMLLTLLLLHLCHSATPELTTDKRDAQLISDFPITNSLHKRSTITSTNIAGRRHTTQTPMPRTDETHDHWSTEETPRRKTGDDQNTMGSTVRSTSLSESANIVHRCTTYPPLPGVVGDTVINMTGLYSSYEQLRFGNCRYLLDPNKMKQGCRIELKVPAEKIIKLDACVCRNVRLGAWQYDDGNRLYPDILDLKCENRGLCDFTDVFSSTSYVRLLLAPYLVRPYYVPMMSFNFTVANKSDSPSLEITYITPTSGYIRSPGDSNELFLFYNCVTLSPPRDHVIFLNPFNRKGRGPIHLFAGGCRQRQQKSRNTKEFPVIFPDSVPSYREHHDSNRDSPLSILYTCALSDYTCATVTLAFSYHGSLAKPQQIGKKWNCSASMWPELHRNFPCDLEAQCADGEDEANCLYTSKNGPGQIFMDKCTTTYRPTLQPYYSFAALKKDCNNRGAVPVSFHSVEEWNAVEQALDYYVFSAYFWLDLHQTRLTLDDTDDMYLRNLYIRTWQWGSGSIAYYMDHSLLEDDTDCTRALISNFFIDSQSKQKEIAVSRCIPKEQLYPWSTYPSACALCKVPSSARDHYQTKIVLNTTGFNITVPPVALLTCVSGHVTHVLLACDPKSLCSKKLELRGRSHTVLCRPSPTQTAPYFSCGSAGQFIPYSLVCDWHVDCGDDSDEAFCEFPSCGTGFYDCGQQQCIENSKVCDGYDDCLNLADEKHCRWAEARAIFNITGPPAVVSFDRPGRFSLSALPHGTTWCPETHFRCPGDGYCLPVYTRCNGMADCPGQEDEAECDLHTCAGLYRCRGLDRTICMHTSHICDGFSHCPHSDDELMCQMKGHCVAPSACYGTSFHRSEPALHLRYMDVKGTCLSLDVINLNVMMIHLGVSECNWRNLSDITLPNLHILDLSDNLLHSLNFKHFRALRNLKELVLAGNPLSGGMSGLTGPSKLINLLLLNLSRVTHYNLSFISDRMPRIQILDLSQSGLRSLRGKDLFRSLNVLDLRGCPVSDFSPGFMKGMDDLREVFGDNFKLCCAALLPDTFTGKCSAPVDEISSCRNLLKSGFYAFTLVVFAFLALFGNSGSFAYRLKAFFAGKNMVSFTAFVIHLALSDFLMGVYLLIIGISDRVYAGSYLWNEMTWKRSAACSTAGFLSILSCEVSSFIICLITLDRFLVTRFPFSHLKFRIISAHVACFVAWGLGMILASIPLLPVTRHWEFYRQTAICIPLPVTRIDFSGRHYSFIVMIVLNFVLFLLIAAGQVLIYLSVRTNMMPDDGAKIKNSAAIKDKARSKEFTIASRLLVIALSDFLCWFPIGVCGLLAKLDVAISGEINAAMATIILPFNAALNPFLYTYTTLRQKRQRDKETSLQMFITAQIKRELAALGRQ